MKFIYKNEIKNKTYSNMLYINILYQYELYSEIRIYEKRIASNQL